MRGCCGGGGSNRSLEDGFPVLLAETLKAKIRSQNKWTFDELAVGGQEFQRFGFSHGVELFRKPHFLVNEAGSVEELSEIAPVGRHLLQFGERRRMIHDGKDFELHLFRP